MTDWKKIRKEFETSDISMKKLAEKHNVKYATLRSRKSREKWGEDVATQDKQRGNKKNDVATKKAVKELSNNSELTPNEKKFCLLYLQYFNATKAYQETFNCKYSTARTEGSKLLAKPSVKEEMTRLKEAQKQDLYLDALDVKKQWIKQAFADIGDYVEFVSERHTEVDENGKEKTWYESGVAFKDQDEVDTSLIEEVKMGRDGPVIKLYDKQKAMDRLDEFLSGTSSSGRTFTIIQDDWADSDDDST